MERVEAREWLSGVGQALTLCEHTSAQAAPLLRHVHRLLEQAPGRYADTIRPIALTSLQDLLDAEAYESATLRLVGRCGYMMSRDSGGHVVASIVLPGSSKDYSFNSFSETQALCGALLLSLQEHVISG
jgi:hypothetical protein